MNKILIFDKPVGETPLDTIKEFQQSPEGSAYQNVKLGYAGRLDPMAEGLLLVMVGDENKERDKYLGLDKTYEIEVLFGVSTDSFDVLGMLDSMETSPLDVDHLRSRLSDAVKSFTGTFEQKFPPYSSKTVQGKPLYWWARKDRLDEIEIPNEQRTIHDIEFVKEYKISSEELHSMVNEHISLVQGEFRQDKIANVWDEFFRASTIDDFLIAKMRVECSSGTYMRQLAQDIGKKIGIPALALSIKRTRVGEFSL